MNANLAAVLYLVAGALFILALRGLSNPASSLYAKNLYAFLEILVDKPSKTLAVKWDDEIVKATALTRDGAVTHPSFAPKSAA